MVSTLRFWIWLTQIPRLKNQSCLALLHRFSSPERLYYADQKELLLAEDVHPKQVELLARYRDLSFADRILGDCQRLNLRILTIFDAEYPDRLRNIVDPPCLLYVKGNLPVFDAEAAIAVVGTRDCTPYGILCAEKLGYGIASGGGLVVSGMAKGIDAAATRGALLAGERAVGVLGNGLDIAYPYENQYLYEDVASVGALLSEYPPGSGPLGWHFPVRNRILSGLCAGTLVVEAPFKSGALITAAHAIEQGREVFAVPGPIDAPFSRGCNHLIQSGAKLVMNAWDILQEYQEEFPEKLRRTAPKNQPDLTRSRPSRKDPAAPAPEPEPEPSVSQADRSAIEASLTEEQTALLRLLPKEEPALVDDLIEQSGLSAQQVLSILTVLEMEKLAVQHSGKRYTCA